MSIRVEFPDELLVATREDPQAFARKVMIYTLGHLYEQGKISSGVGAQVLGWDRLEFYRLLSEHGFSVIHYTAEELEEEVRTSRKIAARVQRSWINDTDQPRPQFVVCINNAEYPASLELYKIY